VLGSVYRVDMGSAAEFSYVHTAPILRFKGCKAGIYVEREGEIFDPQHRPGGEGVKSNVPSGAINTVDREKLSKSPFHSHAVYQRTTCNWHFLAVSRQFVSGIEVTFLPFNLTTPELPVLHTIVWQLMNQEGSRNKQSFPCFKTALFQYLHRHE
jgi:hypothetical protein